MNDMNAELDAPVRPDVWTIPGTGMEWCQCGQDHEVTRADVDALYDGAVGPDGLVPHEVVVRVTQQLWRYELVCRFFRLAVEHAAEIVAGSVLERYTRDDAIDITGRFTKTWQGCPEEACAS